MEEGPLSFPNALGAGPSISRSPITSSDAVLARVCTATHSAWVFAAPIASNPLSRNARVRLRPDTARLGGLSPVPQLTGWLSPASQPPSPPPGEMDTAQERPGRRDGDNRQDRRKETTAMDTAKFDSVARPGERDCTSVSSRDGSQSRGEWQRSSQAVPDEY